MKIKKWTVVLLFASFLLSLFGCGKGQIQDGPGMVNDQPWCGFSLSRSDSYAQYNFWFEVQKDELGWLLTGECRDEDGDMFSLEAEDGIVLSTEDLQYLRGLWLGDLPDVASGEDDDEPFLLDAPTITFVLTWLDGNQQEKVLPDDLSFDIYLRFLPYFQRN